MGYYFQKFSESFWFLKSLFCFYITYKTLSFNLIYYSLGFSKEMFFKREFVIFWSSSAYCNCCSTTSGLEECDWGVGYSLVVVILCGSSSGSEILLGEGGDVERVLESRNKSLCLQLVYLYLLLHSFLYCRSIILQQDCIAHLKLLFRGITRKKFRALHVVYGF